MFLMNVSPVPALQSRWEAFRLPGNFRVPGCCSEPAEGVGGATVSAGVQMLIRTLRRGDPAALGSSHEPGLQRRQEPERSRDSRPPTSPAEPKQPPRDLESCSPGSADPHPASGEGAAGLGAPAPDSDSDDSVDRGIEEAIQEYLKARSGGPRPPGAPHNDHRCLSQPPRVAPCTPTPARRPCGGSGSACQPLGSASPGSASSEDSFEEGIRADIEQFLREKRQLGAPGEAICVGGREEPAPRPAPRARREPELSAVAKEFVFRKPPRFARIPALRRGLRFKATPDPGTGSTRLTTGRSAELAQTRGGVRKVSVTGRRGRRGPSTILVPEAPDSSSDDGIEEAIQLYQLEKSREVGGTPNMGHGARSTLPESHRKVAAGARKPPAGKVGDLGPTAPEPRLPARPPPDTTAIEAGGQGPCRADASTELLCAEAILDISKTILPAPTEGRERGPPSLPPHVPASSDGSGSSVDSDDSIEQEIRTFLALKAQAGVLPATVETSAAAVPGPHIQAGGLQAPLPHSLALSLSHKRSHRAGGHTPALTMSRSTRETPKEGAQEAPPHQGRACETPVREGESRGQALLPRTVGPGDEPAAPHIPTSLSLGPGAAEEEDSSGDKSSSLDSDEDLDAAIKELLSSKRKRRKGRGGPRAAPPPKVRLGAAPKVLYRLERAWKHKGPALWRRFSKPQRARGLPRQPTPSGAPRSSPKEEASAEDGPPGMPTRTTPEGNLFSGSRELRPPAQSPSSTSEEDSSVDSDDSIEVEIRKFLAEKAKESRGGPGTPHPGVCTRSQRGRGAASTASAFTQAGRGSPRAESARCELASPRSAKGLPGSRRPICAHRDQSPRVAEPAAGDGNLGTLPGCVAAAAPAESPGIHCPGRSSLSQSLAADRETRAAAGLALPWTDFAQQSRLQSLWALSPEGSGGAWKGAEGQARCLPSLALDPKKSLPFAGVSPLLPTQLFRFGRSVSWGAKPSGLFSSPLNVSLQGPSFSAFRGAQAARGPVFGSSHMLLKKEGGHWPPGRAQAGHSVHDARRGGPEEDTVDLRCRGRPGQREEDEQEALGSGASDLSDSSMEEGGGSWPGAKCWSCEPAPTPHP